MKFFIRIKNFIKAYPFILMIVLSCAAFSTYEAATPDSMFRKNLDSKILKLMENKSDVTAVDAISDDSENKKDEAENKIAVNEAGEAVVKTDAESEADEADGISEEEKNEEKTEEKEIINTSLYFNEPSGVFKQVDRSYFDDALFIGDSRTIALQIYGGLLNPTYYTSQGTNVWKIFTEEIAPLEDGTMGTIEQGLMQKKFAKIYIMLGVNELGTGTHEEFLAQYRFLLNRIRQLQPQAVIFLQSVFHVTREKSDTEEFINNFIINERNLRIATLADNKKVFFIDSNKVLDDETGALKKEYSKDGVHLIANKVGILRDFIFSRGIEIPKEEVDTADSTDIIPKTPEAETQPEIPTATN